MQDNKLKIIRLIKAIIVFIISSVGAAFMFAAGMYFLESGYEFSPLFATLCLAVGCFAASLYLGNAIGEKGLIIGLLVAACVFIAATLLSLIVNSAAVSLHLLLRFVILLLASLIGAVIGVNKKANKKFI